jgi:hypothetical protein
MRVLLPDAYFDGNVATAELHAILLRCIDGPHLLETEPLADLDENGIAVPPPKFRIWLAAQGEPWASVTRMALEIGLRWSHAWQPRRTIRLTSSADSWTTTPQQLQPIMALRLLQLPLLVVVEDAVNDAHFVRALTRPEFSPTLRDAERFHWLEFSHGGGIGSAPRLVDAWKHDPLSVCRRFVIFDSDARTKGQPSSESEKLRQGCLSAQIPHHQLHRRSIENYLPLQALHQWAQRGLAPVPQTSAMKLVVALQALPVQLRYFYNFKSGRKRDRARKGAKLTTAAWRRIPLSHRVTLRDGVHSDIASLFAPGALMIKPRWVETEDAENEMFGMIKEILANL